MSGDLCRLCLSATHLGPIFVDTTQNKEYTKILTLTTGLLIKLNDGLPQNICLHCTQQINSGLNFRNLCQASETKLLEIGFKKLRKGAKTDTKKKEKELIKKLNNDDSKNYDDNHSMGIEVHEFEIKVEFDRITDNVPSPDVVESNASNIVENPPDSAESPPNRAQNPIEKKLTRKEKREAFLRLVDGVFDPKGPVTCKVCKKSYNGWPSFVSHTKLHLGFKYVCEYCGKSFISSTQLNRHCRSHHGMSRDLRCRHCDYLALDKPQLQLHERRVHTGERPFVCDQCSASYYSRRCLIQHIESHQTSSNVQCEQCPQRFKSRRHLARHTYSAHTSKRYSYKCPVCSQVYRNCKYIRVHLKKQHSLTSKEAKIIKIKL